MSHDRPADTGTQRPGDRVTRDDERLLVRALSGELGGDRTQALERRLGSEPALAAAHRRLSTTWRGLDALDEDTATPLDLRDPVLARLHAERDLMSWSTAPAWARVAASAALLSGAALGWLAAPHIAPPGPLAPPDAAVDLVERSFEVPFEVSFGMLDDSGAADASWADASWAEALWLAVEDESMALDRLFEPEPGARGDDAPEPREATP
ncbi:MAG: hypothetical protein AAGC60_11995 [Acidobacteriota bacterium]